MDPDLDLLEKFVLSSEREEVLKLFPENSEFKACMSLFGSLNSENFQQLFDSCKNLSAENRRKLILMYQIQHLDDPNCMEVLRKMMFRDYNYAPPQELRAQIKSQLPSWLNQEALKVDFEKAAKDLEVFRGLTNLGKMKVNVEEMSEKVFEAFLGLGLTGLLKEGVVERIAKELETKKNYSVISGMTIDQLEKLEKLVPSLAFTKDFVKAKLRLQYNFKEMNTQEKYHALNSLYNYSKATKITEFLTAVLLSLMSISADLLIFDRNFVLEYFACHRSNSIYKLNSGIQESVLKEFLALLPQVKSENIMLQEFLDEILPTIDNYLEFLYPVKESEAKKFFARAMVLAGTPITDFKGFMTDSELSALESSTELSFIPTNAEVFLSTETVNLSLKLKNIKDLTVRVIELNGKNYFTSTEKTLNFDGLTPSSEYFYTYTHPAQTRHTESFEFSALPKIGIFYIEFIASGLRTSAVIKKGSLKCLFKTTVAGQAVTLIDENNQVCSTGGVYLDNKFFPLTKSYVILPYAPEAKNKNLVLTNGEIFSVFNFLHLTSEFNLDCGFLINEEELIVGNTASVFVAPKVRIHGKDCEEWVVSKVEADIKTEDIDGLTSSKHFDQLEYEKAILELRFNVPPRLRSCTVEVTVTVKVGKDEKVLKANKRVEINVVLTRQDLYCLYLRKGSKGFSIEARGRNGEPWENVEVSVKINNKYLSKIIDVQLVTDENGEILLGDLKSVKRLEAGCQCSSLAVDLSLYKASAVYPKEIVLCEGDQYSLPLHKKPKGPLSSFAVLLEKSYTKNASDHISYDESSRSLLISGLEKGNYQLWLLKHAVNISVSVTEGIHFNNLDYVISENSVSYTSGQFNYFTIASEKSENEVTVQVSGSQENLKAYVLYSNFLPSQDFAAELKKIHKCASGQQWNFKKQSNEYYEPCALSEEYSYVLNRKRQSGFIGNTLPRPQVLMKRHLQGEAKTQTQLAKEGMHAYRMRDLLEKGSPRSSTQSNFSSSTVQSSFSADFLRYPSKWHVFPVTSSSFTVPIDVNYTNLSIFVCNHTSVCSSFIATDSLLHLRNLTVPNTFSPDKHYIEQNLAAGVRTGEEFLIKNCENPFEIVDTVEKLFSLLIEVGGNRDLAEWRFLGNWKNLEDKEKEEKIEKFFCYEILLFVFLKDREFFDRALKGFIGCKLEKGLIDLYLLGESLEGYLERFEGLNKLEQVLVVLWLRSVESPEFERKLKGFRERAEANPISLGVRNAVYRKIFQASKASVPMGGFPPGPPPPPPPHNLFPMAPGAPPPPNMNAQFLPMCAPPVSQERYRSITRSFNPSNSAMPVSTALSQAHLQSKKKSFLSDFTQSIKSDSIQCELMDMDNIPQSELQSILEVPSFYQKMESTKKYTETNYFSSTSSTFSLNHDIHFWLALITSKSEKQEFLSEFCLFTDKNLASLISILAFTDLPFQSPQQVYTTEGKSIKINAMSNFLVFFKDLSEGTYEESGKILAAHQYLNPITKKFVNRLTKQVLYECNLVVTNITSEQKDLEILQILPEGSIPINPPQSTKTVQMTVSGYSTLIARYSFYFPASGNFAFFPASISEKSVIIASASTITPQITDTEVIESIQSFSDVILTGSSEKILEFIKTHNPYLDIDLKKIYFKLKEKDFWVSLIQILEEKDFNDEVVLSYSLYHSDIPRSLKYLKKNQHVRKTLQSMWEEVSEDPVHHEFSPLVNARAYQLGQQKRIANAAVLQEYKSLLLHFAYKKTLSVSDKLRICQYLLYKDDFAKAKNLFDSFAELSFTSEKPLTGPLQIQLDYLRAYFYPENALTIAAVYLNYPILHWRKKFEEVYQIMNEVSAAYNPEQIIIKEHPGLSFSVSDSKLKLDYTNLKTCTALFYPIDLEVVFSLNPELNQDNLKFSYSKPVFEMKIELIGSGKKEIPLPEALEKKNLFVEVEFDGNQQSQVVFEAEIRHLLFETQGVVKVVDKNNRPRSAVYVKTFAKRVGKGFEFYKDGFTDIRGKFDYVSLANCDLESLEKFSILVCDKELGAVVVSAKPPPQ